MEKDKILLKDMIFSELFNKWVKIIDKTLISNIEKNYHNKNIIILYEPYIEVINFRSLFDTPFGCNQLSIEDYIKKKLRRNELTNYIPKLDFCKDPLGLNQDMVRIFVRYHKFNEFERIVFKEWELIVYSGIIDSKISEMFRTFKTSCIIIIDRNSKDIIRHQNVFYDKVLRGYSSIYDIIIKKLKVSYHAFNFNPYTDFINDPNGLDTKVFVIGITQDKNKLSPRYFHSIKTSK
jgi:hypothetical protein